MEDERRNCRRVSCCLATCHDDLRGRLVLQPGTALVSSELRSTPSSHRGIADQRHRMQFIWVFSEVLESVCVLPQLLLLRQTTVPTVITSFYIVFLGSYRALYLVNWVLRAANMDYPDGVSVLFGIVQTALYADFAWVYWTRQRVKLRNGGVVDADDLRNGWLLGRIFGKLGDAADGEDEETAPALGSRTVGNGQAGTGRGAPRAKWGARGISISADDGVLDRTHEESLEQHGVADGVDPDAKMQDPDELAKVLDEEDDDDVAQPGTRVEAAGPSGSGVGGGDPWNDV